MIRAEHRSWARNLFEPYLTRLLKKHFSGFYILNDPPNITDKQLIVTPNHFSWWDGFFIDFVNKKLLKRKFHIMMLEEQLKRFWFFKKLGAYGFNPNNPKSIIETINYTKEIIGNVNNVSVIYPQGEITPYHKEEVILKQGLNYFLKDSNPNLFVMLIAFKIQYEEEKLPKIYCKFGNLINSAIIKSDFNIYKESFLQNLNDLDEIANNKNFKMDLFRT